MRLAYLGTPETAVPPLRALHDAGHEIAVVVTRPDRRRGRGSATSPSPVKEEAARLGLPVAHHLDAVVDSHPELGVVVAYGRLIPAAVLAVVPMVNLHFSLLPRWRGAAPIERAILAGDDVTGVCLMALEEGLDTGPLYVVEAVPIGAAEHLGALRGRLVAIGSRLLVGLLAGPLPQARPQVGDPTYADKITTADLELRWERPAAELLRVVRLDRAWTTWRGRRLRILEAAAVPTDARVRAAPAGALDGDVVLTGEGGVRLVTVQPEGREAMPATDWLRGARASTGERLGGP